MIRTHVIQLIKSRRYQQVFNIAESGLNKAIHKVINSDGTYTGETDTPLGRGVFSVLVSTNAQGLFEIVSTAYIPNSLDPEYTKTVRSIFRMGGSIVQSEIFSYSLTANNNINMRNSCSTGSMQPARYGHIRANGDISCENSVVINGDTYTAGSVSLENQALITGAVYEGSDPITFPSLDMNYYKTNAQAGGTINGDVEYIAGAINLGPKYITGNLIIRNSANVNLTGTVYVQGNIVIKNSSNLKGNNILCSQGTVSFQNTSTIGQNGEIVGIITNSTDSQAISLCNTTSAAECVLYVPNGGVKIDNSATIRGSVAANTIDISNSARVYLPDYNINLDLPGNINPGARNIVSWEQDN
ncbi:hypothetical protein ACFL4O_02015, partial [bacterium]